MKSNGCVILIAQSVNMKLPSARAQCKRIMNFTFEWPGAETYRARTSTLHINTPHPIMSEQLDQAALLIIGATGYIGGSVLVAIREKYPKFQYTAVIRNPKDNQAIEALGARILQGSNADLDLIEKASSEVDIVVNCSDADDVPLADAIIKGLMTRAGKKDGSRKPIYLHTRYTSA